jgi:DsbC/DsbD-like thiol-disulfide interchange protein
VPAYKQPFRIALPVTIKSTSKKGDVVTIAGAVRYQACDDRLCYPVTAAPVSWTVSVK